MTRYAFSTNPPVLFPTFAPFIGPKGETYPPNFIELAPKAEREAANIYPVTEDPAPAGKVIKSETIKLVNKLPVAKSVFENAPEPERRKIKKSVIHERVNETGKLAAVLAVLQTEAILYARWFAPDWPEVYFDDPNMLAVLAGVGCTPEEVAAITA